MKKKLPNKTMTIDAEMMGKASFFCTDPNLLFTTPLRGVLQNICLMPSSALNEGMNIVATDAYSLVIFNDSVCDTSNFFHSSKGRIWINCVRDKNYKLTDFIKDCRNRSVLKKYKNFKLTFLHNAKCRIRFNNRQYTFKYGNNFPDIDSVVSKVKIPFKTDAMTYNPKFMNLIKHINLSWHDNGLGFKDVMMVLQCSNGTLLSIKPGVILISMPLLRNNKKKAIERFVRGISSKSSDSNDLFSVAFKKRAYEKEFGFWIGNDLQTKKARF